MLRPYRVLAVKAWLGGIGLGAGLVGIAIHQRWLVSIAVPMHTALRLGVRAAERIRQINATCRIVCHGLYAELNAAHLLGGCADIVLGAESEAALVDLAERLDAGEAAAPLRPGRK